MLSWLSVSWQKSRLLYLSWYKSFCCSFFILFFSCLTSLFGWFWINSLLVSVMSTCCCSSLAIFSSFGVSTWVGTTSSWVSIVSVVAISLFSSCCSISFSSSSSFFSSVSLFCWGGSKIKLGLPSFIRLDKTLIFFYKMAISKIN